MLGSLSGSIRRVLLPIALISTIASHGLTLMLPDYHSLLTNALSHLVPNIKANPSELNKLKKDNDKLKKSNSKLQTKNKGLNTTLAQHRKSTTTFTNKLKKRLVRNVAVNTGSVLTESVPFYGAAIVVGVTAMDVTDACNTMNDLNDLLQDVGQEPDQGTASTVCSSIDKIPTANQIADYWLTGMDSLKADISAQLKSLPTIIDGPLSDLQSFLDDLIQAVKSKSLAVIDWCKDLLKELI